MEKEPRFMSESWRRWQRGEEDWIDFQMLTEASQLNIYERIYCRTGTIEINDIPQNKVYFDAKARVDHSHPNNFQRGGSYLPM